MRFKTVKKGEGVYQVHDTQSDEYKMPRMAVSMNMSFSGATSICNTLNHEWRKFLNNPQ